MFFYLSLFALACLGLQIQAEPLNDQKPSAINDHQLEDQKPSAINNHQLNDQKPSNKSDNIWDFQIDRKVKTIIKYKLESLAVWEEKGDSPSGTRQYYVMPPATLIPSSASCKYVAITDSYDVSYEIQLWEKDLPGAVVAGLKNINLTIREDQVHPYPFYQARVIWNSPKELKDLKLSPSWINNLRQQQVYKFLVVAANNQSCNLLADTIRTRPEDFVGYIQLQFIVSAAKIDSKTIDVKSEHVMSSQLVAALKNLPGADGSTRYLSSDDYNRMLLEISNHVLASEVTTGDYVDADDELSLKDAIVQMFKAQKENTAQFDDKMWNSTFWNPLDQRPDQITKELNHVIYINKTDNLAYLNQSSTSSLSAELRVGLFGIGGSHSSSSSVTMDKLNHFLEKNNIRSEIEGNKFVPKKLDLQRINLNDLTRKDVLLSKKIRVKQVDIGSVLQIVIGNSSVEALEDENRHLREQIANFQNGLTQMQATINAIQGNITELQDSETGIRVDIGALQNQTKYFHICKITEHPKGCVKSVGCPEGKFLRGYDVRYNSNCEGGRFDLAYTICCYTSNWQVGTTVWH